MYENRSRLFQVMGSEMSSECKELGGIFWYTMIRPRLKVVMSHLAFFSILNCLKKKCETSCSSSVTISSKFYYQIRSDAVGHILCFNK